MSWKKYGEIDKYEKMNHIKASSIVTDTIVVKESFLSDFVVDGTMTVNEETFLKFSRYRRINNYEKQFRCIRKLNYIR